MNWRLPDLIVLGVPVTENHEFAGMVATLIGALIGGLVVILGDFALKKREQRLDQIERDYELYILLNEVINDVWAIGSRYIPAVEKHGWPMSPAAVMQPAIGDTENVLRIPARLLTTIRTKEGKGLPHKIVEATRFRNIIVSANITFQVLHTKVVEMVAPHADISKGMRMGADLDNRNPEHKSIIVAIERADSMAKQLLQLILDFYSYTVDLAEHYNTYHAKHPIKKMKPLLIDIEGIREQMSKYLPEASDTFDRPGANSNA